LYLIYTFLLALVYMTQFCVVRCVLSSNKAGRIWFIRSYKTIDFFCRKILMFEAYLHSVSLTLVMRSRNKIEPSFFPYMFWNVIELHVLMHLTYNNKLRYRVVCTKPPGFGGVRVVRSLVFCAMFCRWLFVLFPLFFWPLCCLSFFYLRPLVTPLVSIDHCVACPSSIYGFWLPLWYLLTIVLSVLLLFTASDYLFGLQTLS
jgi:hypothetical protein